MMMLLGGLILVVVGIVAWQYINNVNNEPKEKRKAIPQSAKEILDERYANDELTREEYLAVLEDLEAHQQYK